MKTVYVLCMLILSTHTVYADREKITNTYSFISDVFKNPKTQPLGHYYQDEDGFSYIYKNELYKTHVVRIISNTKSCRGSVMLDLLKDSKRVQLWYHYDLNKQSFHIRDDLIILASDDKNSTITLNYRFENEDGKILKQKTQSNSIHFGWRAAKSHDLRLKQAFMKYSELCKSSAF